MPKYLVKITPPYMGKDQVIIESDTIFSVGASVSIAVNAPTTLADGKGGGLTLNTGVTLEGTVNQIIASNSPSGGGQIHTPINQGGRVDGLVGGTIEHPGDITLPGKPPNDD